MSTKEKDPTKTKSDTTTPSKTTKPNDEHAEQGAPVPPAPLVNTGERPLNLGVLHQPSTSRTPTDEETQLNDETRPQGAPDPPAPDGPIRYGVPIPGTTEINWPDPAPGSEHLSFAQQVAAYFERVPQTEEMLLMPDGRHAVHWVAEIKAEAAKHTKAKA